MQPAPTVLLLPETLAFKIPFGTHAAVQRWRHANGLRLMPESLVSSRLHSISWQQIIFLISCPCDSFLYSNPMDYICHATHNDVCGLYVRHWFMASILLQVWLVIQIRLKINFITCYLIPGYKIATHFCTCRDNPVSYHWWIFDQCAWIWI